MAFEAYWNEQHKKYSTNTPVYDDWLDKYQEDLKNVKSIILDLGCGCGNDSLYLTERGYQVLACDYSDVALESVKQHVKNVDTKYVDISKTLPFNDDEFEVIIADLSLHYFSEEITKQIMNEIKRILKPNGILLARVNSIQDSNYGAGQGEKIEENYYYVDGYNKRFFSIDDCNKYFSLIGNVTAIESEMLRYSKPKKVIEIRVQKL